jgi:phosphoribosylformylglycinamidine synthase
MNFGNPQKPEIMWQFARSVDGMAEACRALDVPVISGNVSLYNETDGVAILPTPGLAMVGLYEGPTPTVSAQFTEGLEVALIGQPGRGWLAGSVYARSYGYDRHGAPPPVDYATERALHDALRRLVMPGTSGAAVAVAHDLSEGGLLLALAECCMGGVGGVFDVANDAGALYGEDHGRALIAYRAEDRERVVGLLDGVPLRGLGNAGGSALVVAGRSFPVAELRAVWETAFPGWLDGGTEAS